MPEILLDLNEPYREDYILLMDVDIERFWKDDEQAHLDNCFNENSCQVALGVRMLPLCILSELGVEGDPWAIEEMDPQLFLDYKKRYNDKSEKIVGIRMLSEESPRPPETIFPAVKRIGEVFGGKYIKVPNSAEWLESDIKTAQELEKLLDKVDSLDIREFILPDNWKTEKKRIYEQFGISPGGFSHIRGPVTLAMSIFGVENLIFLYYDARELYRRFSRTIQDTVIKMRDIMAVEAYGSVEDAPHGFAFLDDNCSMLTAEMYEEFGYPVLKGIFDHCSPDEGDLRFQHSDSEMGHLLPILARLNLTGCNFGPTVLVDEIRKYMPKTRIDGCLAPFTFMSNDDDAILAEVKRDCDMIKASGTRGLNISTAGSINDGALLKSMRTVMYGIQKYGRY